MTQQTIQKTDDKQYYAYGTLTVGDNTDSDEVYEHPVLVAVGYVGVDEFLELGREFNSEVRHKVDATEEAIGSDHVIRPNSSFADEYVEVEASYGILTEDQTKHVFERLIRAPHDRGIETDTTYQNKVQRQAVKIARELGWDDIIPDNIEETLNT
jgi:hypothetical protein